MFRLTSMIVAAVFLLGLDGSGVTRLEPPTPRVEFPSDQNLPVLPDMSPGSPSAQQAGDSSAGQSTDQSPSQSPNQSPDQTDKPKTRHINIPKDDEDTLPSLPTAKAINGPLQPASRLALVRYVGGEYARAVAPLPAGKDGIHIKAGVPFSEQQLRMTLGSSGAALNPGDKAQITTLEFKERQIVVDVNGGGRGKKKLRDRIHMEVGGMPTMTTTTGQEAPVNTNAGATVYLDFDKPLPDMTPDDLKQYLSALLDFSKQHSAAVQWMDSLPPEMQNAITEKRPIVGMDHEMVVAAMGRPDRKVREKNSDGDEIEDWIYGKPPAKTVFVEFDGDKVTQVKQFP